MDRLFGKQISNLLEANIHNRAKQPGRIHSQSSRVSLQQQHPKLFTKRFNRSSFGTNQNKKNQKVEKGEKAQKIQQIDKIEKLQKIQKIQKLYRLAQNFQKQQQISLRQNNFLSSQVLIKQSLKQIPKDIHEIADYFDDCLKFMLNKQARNHSLKNYINDQTQINEKMRGILIDWIVDLHNKFKMFPQTLHAAIMIIDLYLSRRNATKQNLQLIGTSALFIAAKYQETYRVPQLDDLVHFSAKAFNKQEIIKMEADIINALGFQLIMQTSFRFFEPLAKISKMEGKDFYLAQYNLELAMLDMNFLNYKPSILACASIYLINKIKKKVEPWPLDLQKLTSYNEAELKGCARQLCHVLQKADQLSNTKSLRKKFSSSQYLEVTKIKLERKKQ